MTITVRDESQATQARLGVTPSAHSVSDAWAEMALAGSCAPAIKALVDPLLVGEGEGEGVAKTKEA